MSIRIKIEHVAKRAITLENRLIYIKYSLVTRSHIMSHSNNLHDFTTI